MDKESEFVIAIDFECAGGVSSLHGFTQLGAVLVRCHDSQVMDEFNSYASMLGYEWEERCVKEFWEKHPERYQETRKAVEHAPNPYDVVKSFVSWVKEAIVKHQAQNAIIITDNGGFDTVRLGHFLKKDLLYITGGYRDIIDVSTFFYGLSRSPITVELLNSSSEQCALDALGESKIPDEVLQGVSKDHHPVNDAKTIAFKFCYIQKKLHDAMRVKLTNTQ